MYQGNPGFAGMNPHESLAGRLDFSEVFRRVYLWLAVGLTIGFGVAFALGQVINTMRAAGQGALVTAIFFNPIAVIASVVVYLAIGFTFYPVVRRANPAVGGTLFVIFAAVFGFMTAAIFVEYTGASIAAAFFTTATMFAIMTLIGFTTSIDLSKFGSVLLMALIGLIIASVVNSFLHSTLLFWIVSLAGVAIFSAFTAYDTQWVKRNALSLASSYGSVQDEELISRIALIGAFRLFLDFVNLFYSLLRIFGRQS